MPFLIQHQLPCVSGLVDYLLARLLLRHCEEHLSPGSSYMALCTRIVWWAVCSICRPWKLPAQLLLQHQEMGRTTISISYGMGTTSVIHVLLPTLLTLATPSGTAQDYKNLLQIKKIWWCDCCSILACSQGISFPAHCKGRGEWGFSWKPSQNFQARCRTLCCSQPDKWDERSN